MKKFLAIALALVMVLGLFAGCGSTAKEEAPAASAGNAADAIPDEMTSADGK